VVPPALGVLAAAPGDLPAAERLASELGVALVSSDSPLAGMPGLLAVLVVADGSLRLQQTGPGAPGPVTVGFEDAAMRHRRQSGHNEMLGRAVGVGRKAALAVLDATAGLGRDAFVLADLGCRVRMCEREPLLAVMLRWALARAAGGADPWVASVASRIELRPGDARELSRADIAEADVIYLDPMFPQRAKHAAIKKEMALLQRIFSRGCREDDSSQLLTWALDQPVTRVAVKRPLRAPWLGDRRPTHALRGRAVRYDIYTLGPWH
jgi:16S rRNA (guanine1516-N2)-methyltransferase